MTRSRRAWLQLVALTLMGTAGCTSPHGPVKTRHWEQAQEPVASLDPQVEEMCSGDLGRNLVPDSVTTDPYCKLFVGWHESALCLAYAHFNAATRLEAQAGVSWAQRLAHFRAAVEQLSMLLFDSQDLPQVYVDDWKRNLFEDRLYDSIDWTNWGRCQVGDGSNPDNIDELIYLRQLKLQGLELYKRVSDYFVYALVARGDASREDSGNIGEYSDRVWGPDAGDPALRLPDLTGDRGAAIAFLLGTDVAVLDDLVLREGREADGFRGVRTGCGSDPNTRRLYSEHVCNEHMVVPLPGFQEAMQSAVVSQAVGLLQRTGIPIGSDGRPSTDSESLAQFVWLRVNQERTRQGLPPYVSPSELLDAVGTDTDALSAGSRALQALTGLYLYDLRRVHDETLPSSYRDFETGYGGSRADVQSLLVRSRINGSRLGYEDVNVIGREVPIYLNTTSMRPFHDEQVWTVYRYFEHSYYQTLSWLREQLRYRVNSPGYLYWAEAAGDTAVVAQRDRVDQPYRDMIALIDDEIGQSEVRYLVQLEDVVTSGPPLLTKRWQFRVAVGVPAGEEPIALLSGSWTGAGSPPQEAPQDGLDGLRCLTFGEVGGTACDLQDYALPELNIPLCWEGYQCKWYQVDVDGSVLTGLPEYPIFVLRHGAPLDGMVLGRGQQWQGMQIGEFHRVTSQVDTPALARLERVLARQPEQPSEAKYNALGLRNDLVPPLENELIATQGGTGGNSYEDSFEYYLSKARDAAQYAGRKIQEAVALEQAEVRYEDEVTEARARAQNRLEQICGEGRDACGVVLTTVTLAELTLVPEMQADDDQFECDGYDQNPYLPNYLAMADPPAVSEPGDLIELGRWLRCHNKQWFDQFITTHRLRDIPVVIAEDPYNEEHRIDRYRGEYHATLLEISNGMIELLGTIKKLFFLQDTLGMEMTALADRVRQAKKGVETQWWAKLSAIMNGIAGLVQSIATKSFTKFVATGYKMMGQVTAAEIAKDAAELNVEATLKESALRAAQRVLDAEQLYDTLRVSLNRIQEGIERLKRLDLEQDQARKEQARVESAALGRALGTHCEAESDTLCLKAYRTLFNTKHLDALEALRRAQKMAFLAKRALEFKLGVDLSRERQAGIIVDAPYRWQDDLYQVFSDEPLYSADPNVAAPYVVKLGDYLYGYPFDHPFADEEDVAILSLRDDLLGGPEAVRCLQERPSTNRVLYSEELVRWDLTGQESGVEKDVSPAPLPPYEGTADRIAVERSVQLTSPERGYDGAPSETVPFERRLVGRIWVRSESPTQVTVQVEASYYERGSRVRTRSSTVRQSAVVRPEQGWVAVEVSGSIPAPTPAEYVTLRMRVRLVPLGRQGAAVVTLWGAQINAGPRLLLYERTPDYEVLPGCETRVVQDPYTGETYTEVVPTASLMADRLRRQFRVKCAGAHEPVVTGDLGVCGSYQDLEYFETSFVLSMEDILSGRVLRQSQFAVGNYNYRIQDIAVNLVGSNVKDCTLDPGAGSACYQNQFIPYDLSHGGHVRLLDYEGKTLRFSMSEGRIHYAKALAAERLLTNPLSSTDTTLLQPYLKSEFRGRPVQGNYTLRIYNVPGLRWDNVEDVQIYLRYRYWSPFRNP